jgi:transposase
LPTAGAYSDIPPELRQLCWAHLLRDFTAWEESGGEEGRIGRWAKAEARRLFSLWHSFERGEILRSELVRRAAPLKARCTRLLYRAYLLGDEKMARISLPLIKQLDALWSFLHHDGVEPTNNMAEQALRAAVIWRKISFGSKSERGLRIVERLLTVAETAKKQKRDLLDYLTQALTAYRTAQPPPPPPVSGANSYETSGSRAEG